MPRTKTTLTDAAETVKPYVERAMSDEKLRQEVLRAFGTARELYSDLIGDRDKPITIASRVATDDDVRDKLREAIEDLRSASERLQGKRERSTARASTLLVAGIALGILFNPVTGAETRRFIRDLISSGGHDTDYPRAARTARGACSNAGRRREGADRTGRAGRLATCRRRHQAPNGGRDEPVRGRDVEAADQHGTGLGRLDRARHGRRPAGRDGKARVARCRQVRR